jgi:hypothetical protein
MTTPSPSGFPTDPCPPPVLPPVLPPVAAPLRVLRFDSAAPKGPGLRILVDCDGVLSDFVQLCLDYVAAEYGLHFTREQIDQWDCGAAMGLTNFWPRLGADVERLQLCRTMPVLPGARAFLRSLERLQGVSAVKICTTPMNVAWLSQRGAWLISEMGVSLDRQIQIHDKQDLAGDGWTGTRWDVLIDDKIENCEAFVNAGGLAFCLAAPYNAACPTHIPRGDHTMALAWVASVTDLVQN